MATHELRLLLPELRTNTGPAFLGAGLIYLLGGLLVTLLIWLQPPATFTTPTTAASLSVPAIIFRNIVGPMGGGGGGGNRTLEAERPRTEPIPATKPPEPQPSLEPVVEPAPEPE